jgi:hypoxanthine phosphoribosyltransferase
VLIVEDIIDTGLTLNYLSEYLAGKDPASLRICALLDKPARRLVDIDISYRGFEIPDRFVIGYGLDYDEIYRNLPYIGVLRPEVYGGE